MAQQLYYSFVLLVVLQILGVSSLTLTISPEYARPSYNTSVVTFTCTADVTLDVCEVTWRDDEGVAGPLLDLSHDSHSQINASYKSKWLSSLAYSGRGTKRGECGLTMEVTGWKHWLVGCRVRASKGGWTYAWANLYAARHAQLTVTVAPREVFVFPGQDASLMIKSQRPLTSCWFYPPSTPKDGLEFDKGSASPTSMGHHVYNGSGTASGECGVVIHNVSEADNGYARGYVWKSGAAEYRYIPVVVARAPGTPTLAVVYRGANLRATCTVDASRPVASITWILDDEVIRQDADDDSPLDYDAPWLWPWDSVAILQVLKRELRTADHGTRLTCRVSHPALTRPLEASHDIVFINTCPPLVSNNVDISCKMAGEMTNCSQPQQHGTLADLRCKPGLFLYDDPIYRTISCLESGKWNKAVFSCSPDCGRANSHMGQPLLAGGVNVQIDQFPWHVGIFERKFTGMLHICSGSLIHTKIVLTAAHCVSSLTNGTPRNSSLFKVAAGKTKREWVDNDVMTQRFDVSAINVHPQYQGSERNHLSDIALLHLNEHVQVSRSVNLICVHWDNLVEGSPPRPPKTGFVAGWGITTQGTVSPVLQSIELPIVSREECFNSLQPKLRHLLNNDAFCAGFINQSISVCPGDSGGSFVYLDSILGKYFLYGVAYLSLIPPDNYDMCNSDFYTAFIRFSTYHKWIRDHV